VFRPKKMRPGDWTCPKCGDNVFSWRKSCNRCGEPKKSSSLKSSLELVHEDLMKGQTIFKDELPQDVIYALERQGYRCKRHEKFGCGYPADAGDFCTCDKCMSDVGEFQYWKITKRSEAKLQETRSSEESVSRETCFPGRKKSSCQCEK
jgi:hypothetical protein